MSFVFRPAIYDGSALYELPRPVTRLRVQDSWDSADFKVPLRDGDFRAGLSRDGIEISVEGQVATQAGVLLADEGAMFSAVAELRERLDTQGDGRFEFFIYHDTTSSTFRKFKSCSAGRTEADLSSARLFSYSLLIHAEDSRLYTTGPGD
ncbi:MAG: hypothetical protein AAF532_02790 [Planctomycetota bacterium]